MLAVAKDASDDGDDAAGMLRGVAASGGVAEGRAVVAEDPAGVELREGEVLVAKATDPGWTPLFGLASAVAVEIGGPLSPRERGGEGEWDSVRGECDGVDGEGEDGDAGASGRGSGSGGDFE